MDCTTADASPASSDVLIINQRIEGQNLQYLKKGTSSAESTTLSFWVKSNKTGTYIAELRDFDNTRSICKAYTISSASTWEKKTLTYDGDTTGTLGNDNGASFYLQLFLGAGSNYTSGTLNTSWNSRTTANLAVGQVNLADSTSNEWYVTGVQLEAGTTASDFEFVPVDINLQRCQRYYEQSVAPTFIYYKTNELTSIANQEVYSPVYYKVEKRATPTLTITGYSGADNQCSRLDTGADLGTNTCSSYLNGKKFFTRRNTNGSSKTIVQGVVISKYFSNAEL